MTTVAALLLGLALGGAGGAAVGVAVVRTADSLVTHVVRHGPGR